MAVVKAKSAIISVAAILLIGGSGYSIIQTHLCKRAKSVIYVDTSIPAGIGINLQQTKRDIDKTLQDSLTSHIRGDAEEYKAQVIDPVIYWKNRKYTSAELQEGFNNINGDIIVKSQSVNIESINITGDKAKAVLKIKTTAIGNPYTFIQGDFIDINERSLVKQNGKWRILNSECRTLSHSHNVTPSAFQNIFDVNW